MSFLGGSAVRPGAAVMACCLIVAAIVSGCSAGSPSTASRDQGRCDGAFASDGSPATLADLDATIKRCADWDDWLRAAAAHPAILDGRDPAAVLTGRCSDVSSGLAGYAVCGTLRLALAPPATPGLTSDPGARPSSHRPGAADREARGETEAKAEAEGTAQARHHDGFRELHPTPQGISAWGGSRGRDGPGSRQDPTGHRFPPEHDSVPGE